MYRSVQVFISVYTLQAMSLCVLSQSQSEPPNPQRGEGGRSALLADIQKGTRLKKVTQVNDRSAPALNRESRSERFTPHLPPHTVQFTHIRAGARSAYRTRSVRSQAQGRGCQRRSLGVRSQYISDTDINKRSLRFITL